jgi:hypothetical protein
MSNLRLLRPRRQTKQAQHLLTQETIHALSQDKFCRLSPEMLLKSGADPVDDHRQNPYISPPHSLGATQLTAQPLARNIRPCTH